MTAAAVGDPRRAAVELAAAAHEPPVITTDTCHIGSVSQTAAVPVEYYKYFRP